MPFSLFHLGRPGPGFSQHSAAVPSPTQRPQSHWPSVHLSAPASHGRNQQHEGHGGEACFAHHSFLRWLVIQLSLVLRRRRVNHRNTHSLKHISSQINILPHSTSNYTAQRCPTFVQRQQFSSKRSRLGRFIRAIYSSTDSTTRPSHSNPDDEIRKRDTTSSLILRILDRYLISFAKTDRPNCRNLWRP